jgi:PAS domain S-box-containing protein
MVSMEYLHLALDIIMISLLSYSSHIVWNRYRRNKTKQSLIIASGIISFTIFEIITFYIKLLSKHALTETIELWNYSLSILFLIILISTYRVINRNEMELNRLVKTSPDAIFRIEPGLGITRANPRFYDILGYSSEEVEELGPNFTELVRFQDREKLLEDMRALNNLQKTKSTEIYQFNNKRGEKIWMEVSLSSIIEDGEFRGLEAIARNITERKRYGERLEALHRHATGLGRSETLEEIGEVTFDAIEEVLGFSYLGFGVVEGSFLRFKYTRGETCVSELPLDGQGLTVRAVRTGETQLIPDTKKCKDYISGRFEGEPESLSELDVPVKIDDEVVAVLNIESERVGAFDKNDQRLLEIFAEHVASAIRGLREQAEQQRYEERLEALHRHATELSEAGSLMEIGKMTFNTINSVLGFTHGGFAVVEGDMLQFIYNFTEEIMKTVQLPLDGPGITVRTIRTGETQLVPDIREDEDFVPGFAEGVYDCLSELAVPVKVGGEAVAVLNVESTRLDAFTDNDRRLLEIFAEHVASAIRGLREQAEQQRYEERLEALHRHSTELGRAETIKEVAERTFNAIESVLGFSQGGFGVVEDNQLRFIHILGAEFDKTFDMPLDGTGIAIRVVKTGKTQLVPDIRLDKDFVEGPVGRELGSLSELAVPVRIGAEVAAVINVESSKLATFTEEDRRLLEIFAEHVAAAISRIKNVEMLNSSERQARNLVEFKDKVIDTAIVWIDLLDEEGNVTLWNRAAELISGYTREEVLGHKKIWEWLYPDPDYLSYVFKRAKEVIKGKKAEHIETTIKCKDGTSKIISWYDRNILDEKGKTVGSIAVGIDVTESKKMDEKLKRTLIELERLNTDLERSNRDLEDYTYVVSHDLKSPLRSITSFSAFLLEDYEDKLDETGKDYLKRMNAASSRMDGLINDLLILSRVGRLYTETEPVDLYELLDTIKTDFKIQLGERGGEILVGEMPTVETQRVWMAQLFTNLIGNGLKFNESSAPRVEVACEERQGEFIFSVSDNGIGIESKHQEQIFKLFKRLHTTDEYPGTGAGLAICKKIVNSFGGDIWVESQLGKGSTFYFTFLKEKIVDAEASEGQPEAYQMIPQVQEEPPTPIE